AQSPAAQMPRTLAPALAACFGGGRCCQAGEGHAGNLALSQGLLSNAVGGLEGFGGPPPRTIQCWVLDFLSIHFAFWDSGLEGSGRGVGVRETLPCNTAPW
ncbi:unnamed protein product, partial [Polarella glacialis]